MEKRSSYQAYLLRGWQEKGNGWRFRLQDVRTGEQMGFTSMKQLLSYLSKSFEAEDVDGSEDADEWQIRSR